jgi:DnaK suppressor protein
MTPARRVSAPGVVEAAKKGSTVDEVVAAPRGRAAAGPSAAAGAPMAPRDRKTQIAGPATRARPSRTTKTTKETVSSAVMPTSSTSDKTDAAAKAKAEKKKTPPAKVAAARNGAAAGSVAGGTAGAPGRTRNAAAKKSPAPSNGAGPYAHDAKFLAEQRELLEGERIIYQGQASDLKAEADSLAQEREPGDVQFDEESGEGGTVTVDRERDLALSAQAQAAVEEIDAALGRIADGTYGACERCHQAIPKPRLKALPFARLCVACKSGGLSRR